MAFNSNAVPMVTEGKAFYVLYVDENNKAYGVIGDVKDFQKGGRFMEARRVRKDLIEKEFMEKDVNRMHVVTFPPGKVPRPGALITDFSRENMVTIQPCSWADYWAATAKGKHKQQLNRQ